MMIGCAASTCLSRCDVRVRVTAPACGQRPGQGDRDLGVASPGHGLTAATGHDPAAIPARGPGVPGRLAAPAPTGRAWPVPVAWGRSWHRLEGGCKTSLNHKDHPSLSKQVVQSEDDHGDAGGANECQYRCATPPQAIDFGCCRVSGVIRHRHDLDPPGVSGGSQTWKDEGPWRHSGNTRRSCGNAR